ncbi:hypothetical protein [Streptomyces sp. NPDC002825]|uniref:hypothetical protein n=1 Tax=Streptomyces sp. NPDC002825 TaxID=3154666 RepID=UPI00331B4A76
MSAITTHGIKARFDRMLSDGVPSVWFCYRRAPWLGVVSSQVSSTLRNVSFGVRARGPATA